MSYSPLASSALRLNKTTRRNSESTDKPEGEQQSKYVESALLTDAKDPAAATKTPPHAVHNEAPPSSALDRRRVEPFKA